MKEEDPSIDFRCWGGEQMMTQGAEVVKHYKDLAFMGFVEVVKNLGTILKNIKFCKKDILNYKPDALIFIDYPGFNLRIAKWAKPLGFKTLYYISPQVWAWKANRVHGMKKSIDQLYTILPFEADFFKKYDYEVQFVGHPLLDVIDQSAKETSFKLENDLADSPIIALLPGSRRQEIKRMLPQMLSVLDEFPDYQFIIGGAPAIPDSFYEALIPDDIDANRVKLVSGQTYKLMQNAQAALVTSGTATLETALFNTPEIVCYQGNHLSYLIAKRLIKVKYISLVNLIVDAPLVKELIQNDFNKTNLTSELKKVLQGPDRVRIFEGYQELRNKLGNAGASSRAAAKMIAYLKSNSRELEQ